MNDVRNDRPLTALLSDLAREIVDLVRKEVALARAEVSEKVSNAETGITSIVAGGAVLLAGLFIVLQAVVAAVELALPPEQAPWLAPLIVGVVVAIIGYAMLKRGRSHLRSDQLVPDRTLHSLRTDRAVVQERVQ